MVNFSGSRKNTVNKGLPEEQPKKILKKYFRNLLC